MNKIANFSPIDITARQDIGLRSGDSVRVWQKIQEKGKTRLQKFEGLVLARRHGNEPGATFTVRTTLSGIGVEKIFPVYSPMIDRIEIVKRSKVRRAKLFYIREKATREIRRQMRRFKLVNISTADQTTAEIPQENLEAVSAEPESAKKE